MKPGELFGRLKSGGKLWIIVLALAAGIILIILGSRAAKKSDTEKDVSVSGSSVTQYEAALEAKIRNICEKVSGVSDVTVAVSLDGGFENVYARDGSDNYVLVGNGSNESGVFLGERAPVISGVGIVCGGGDDPRIQRELISLISAALGIGTNKIFITGAQK